jgi:hypothetical protein
LDALDVAAEAAAVAAATTLDVMASPGDGDGEVNGGDKVEGW